MAEMTDYLATLDEAHAALLGRLVERARTLVPDATEGRGYGMPALLYRGKPLLSLQVTKGHIGLYPFSPAAVEAVAADLQGFSLSKGTIRFALSRPIPDAVFDRVIVARRDQIAATTRV